MFRPTAAAAAAACPRCECNSQSTPAVFALMGTGWLIHGSSPNRSPRRRGGITCIYAPASLSPFVAGNPDADASMTSPTSGVKGEKTPWSEGYLVSGSALGSRIKVLSPPCFVADATNTHSARL
jgi:hypothetical protein